MIAFSDIFAKENPILNSKSNLSWSKNLPLKADIMDIADKSAILH